jgi:hypothetical protein
LEALWGGKKFKAIINTPNQRPNSQILITDGWREMFQLILELGVWVRILDTGYWMLVTGYWIPDS